MKKLIASLVLTATWFCLSPAPAFAGDAATILFESGQKVYITNGFKTIVEEMLKLNSERQLHRIVRLDIEGGTFLLDVAEVVIVCRDRCTSLEVSDVRERKQQ